MNGYIYAGQANGSVPLDDFTVRVVPKHPEGILPAELPLIAWQR